MKMSLTETGNLTVNGNIKVSASNTTGGGLILSDDGGIYDRNDGYASLAFSNGIDIEDAQDTNDHLLIKFDNNYPEIYGYLNGSTTLVEFRTGMYNNGGTFYSQNQIYARAGIANDAGDLQLNDNVVVTGNLTISSKKNCGKLYTNSLGTVLCGTDQSIGRITYYAYKWNRGTTTSIPESVIKDYCGDVDGCKIRMGMYDWNGTGRTASREFLFYYNNNNRNWRAGPNDWEGTNNNGLTQHVYRAWACYFTDGRYSGWKDYGDYDTNFGLLSWNQYNAECRITIID